MLAHFETLAIAKTCFSTYLEVHALFDCKSSEVDNDAGEDVFNINISRGNRCIDSRGHSFLRD